MDDNGPTWQGSRWNAGNTGNEPGGMPRWPQADQPPPFSSRRSARPIGGLSPAALVAALAVSVGANLALCAALIVVVVMARAGTLGPNGPSPLTQGTATASASATPSLSPTASANGLQVTPTTVHLGCDNGQQTQVVSLYNTGSDSVQWQANTDVSYDESGIQLSTRHGTLRAGNSISIKLTNVSHNDGKQGTITFDTQNSTTGAPPTVSYTTDGC